MEISVWQLGILIMAIGFVFVCINLGNAIKSSTKIIVNVNRMIEQNEKKVDNIVTNLDTITEDVEKVVSLGSNISGVIQSVKFVNKIFLKKK
ncbi:DUF948 domain-containing protein [Tepidibacter aestuarii]|uniref:DUF948 domain-containing protein n=1 Tax=Tepidibacter aestuarii TaxID=2925782 RepID=UPI0020BD6F97|nr:DUF948 domain-containing protein [Tepidibacter aestuarii]CAH2215327.1 conserved protein of unknown function [Tepidibacter aestuarii]